MLGRPPFFRVILGSTETHCPAVELNGVHGVLAHKGEGGGGGEQRFRASSPGRTYKTAGQSVSPLVQSQ